MSLLVWLPLNGNLNNNGVANITATNNGATVDANGKIGSCYYCSGSASSYINTNYSTNIGTGDFTIAMWIKIPTITSGSYYAVCTSKAGGAVSTGFGIYWNYSQKKFLWSTANGSQSQEIWMSTAVDSIVYDKWTHLVMIRNKNDARKGYFYINGVRYEIASIPTVLDITTGTNLLLGKCSDNNYPIKAYYNDFRIYDHALSAKEVKEISKGLVMHLPLDNNGYPRPNLLPHTNIAVYGVGYMAPYSSGSTVAVDNTELFNGKPTLKIKPSTSTTSSGGNNLYNSAVPLVLNKTYTYSCYIKSTVADTWDPNSLGHYQVYNSRGAHNSSDRVYIETTVPANRWVRVSQKFKCTADGALFRSFFIYFANTSQTIWVADVKLEEGDTATPWVPNSADSDYADSNIAYDVSGYANNGTFWAYDTGGSIEISSDTARYSASTYINSNNNTTNTASGTRYIYGNCVLTTPNQLTVAFWCKPIAGYSGGTTQGQFSLTNNDIGANAGLDYQTAPFNHRDAIIDINGSNGTTHKNAAIDFTANEWHHYAVVYDGRYGRVYKDGVQTATCDMGSNMALGSMKGAVLGFSKAGGVWRSNKSYYSDFRVYATALSADDIKELYNSPVSIDNGGTIHALTFTENGPNNNVSKQGIVSTGIDQAHYLVPNFSETGNLTGWTVGSGGVLTYGVLVLTGSNISVTSAAFDIGANDIICVEFTVSVPTPSTTTSGPGIYIGTQYGQTNRAISFNFNTNKYNTEGSGTSTNTYFLNSYNSANTNCVRTYIIGSDVDINKVPAAQRSVNTHDINIIRILSGTTTYIRTGYNSNTSMVINISNFKIYKINQHGICENAGEKSIGKGYLSFANYNEI